MITRFRQLVAAWLALGCLLIPAGATHAQANAHCFAETGYCIAGPIRDFWERNGGLMVFGFPITPQQPELAEGRPTQVQWFERSRLELHPENAPPYDVLIGRMGADRLTQQRRNWKTFPRGAADPIVKAVVRAVKSGEVEEAKAAGIAKAQTAKGTKKAPAKKAAAAAPARRRRTRAVEVEEDEDDE